MNHFSNTCILTAIKKKKLLSVEHGLQTKKLSAIEVRWKNFKPQLKDDGITSVSMQHFEKFETNTKNRKVVKHLKAVSIRANLEFILSFT